MAYNESIKPLNWQAPQIEEHVEKASPHGERTEAHHRAGTPITRRGAFNGAPSVLRPNPYARELNPELTLKGGQGSGPKGGNGFGQKDNYIPEQDNPAYKEEDEIGKSNTSSATHMLRKALGTPTLSLRPEQAPEAGGPPPPGGAPSGAGGGQPPDMGDQGQAPGMNAGDGMQQGQDGGQPNIPGAGQMAGGPNGMQNGGMQQQPIGYTPAGLPIYPDPFHPEHQGFDQMDHMAAAAQQAAMGNTQQQNVHDQLGQDTMSPMERATQMLQNAGPTSPGAAEAAMGQTPEGGRTLMPGQPQPNPGAAGGGMPQAQMPPQEMAPPPMPPPEMGAPPMPPPEMGQPPGAPPQMAPPPPMGQPPMPPPQMEQPPGTLGPPPMGQPPGTSAVPPGVEGGVPPQGLASPPMGTQNPYGEHPAQMQEGATDQGKPEAPPQPGPDRDGPKPGMLEKPADGEGGPNMLAQKEETSMPGGMEDTGLGGGGGGDMNPEAGAQDQMSEALDAWLASQMAPGNQSAPTSGSISQQNAKGAPNDGEGGEGGGFPEKQTGPKSPPTHAGNHKTSVEPNAQKSLINGLGW